MSWLFTSEKQRVGRVEMLLKAAKDGNKAEVEKLLKAGVHVDSKNEVNI